MANFLCMKKVRYFLSEIYENNSNLQSPSKGLVKLISNSFAFFPLILHQGHSQQQLSQLQLAKKKKKKKKKT